MPVRKSVPPNTLTDERYNSIVENWNRLKAPDRRQRAFECAQEGHVFKIAPFSTPERTTSVCIRCLKYIDKE